MPRFANISVDISETGVLLYHPSPEDGSPGLSRCLPAHDIPRKIRPNDLCRIPLPSQVGLCLRGSVGASVRVRCEPSSGDSTSAGAENSQATQHAANNRDDDGIGKQGLPCLCFVRSESGMGFKNKIDEELTQRAWLVFNLSIKRTRHQYPRWARTSKFRRQFLKIYKKAQRKNWYRFAYGKSGEFYQVDHIIPLHGKNVSGLHVPWNLHVIAKTINQAKGIMRVPEYE